jgi:hypothetical protein
LVDITLPKEVVLLLLGDFFVPQAERNFVDRFKQRCLVAFVAHERL